jgi:hypothetical protein
VRWYPIHLAFLGCVNQSFLFWVLMVWGMAPMMPLVRPLKAIERLFAVCAHRLFTYPSAG